MGGASARSLLHVLREPQGRVHPSGVCRCGDRTLEGLRAWRAARARHGLLSAATRSERDDGSVESRRSAVAYRTDGAKCERRLSLSLSPRSPSLRFPSPLIEPDVTISVIRLSDGFHMEACTEVRR